MMDMQPKGKNMTRFCAWSDKWPPALMVGLGNVHLLFGAADFAAASYSAACFVILYTQRWPVKKE